MQGHCAVSKSRRGQAAFDVVGALVPPIMGKRYGPLSEALFHGLRSTVNTMKRLVIIGYSFPEADPVVQALVAEMAKGIRQRGPVVFINPDPAACERARRLLGEYERIHIIQKEWSVPLLRQELQSEVTA